MSEQVDMAPRLIRSVAAWAFLFALAVPAMGMPDETGASAASSNQEPITAEVVEEKPSGNPAEPSEAEEASESEQDALASIETSPWAPETLSDVTLSFSSTAPRPLPWRFADLFKAPNRPDERAMDVEEESEAFKSIYNLSIIRNEKVEGHIRYFHIAIRNRFEQWLARLGHYKPIVDNIFSQFGLPGDLVFLSLVESGFNPHAYSRARATGPWQFMKGTAKLYGLRVDQYVDERRDPIKSTVAAARYLRDLYDLFGTWPLAMAAYNAGEGKVMRALQKARAESYWEISRTKLLRRETKEYVPRFMAATIIAKNPSQYGFPEDIPDPHQFEEVIVNRPVQLQTLAAAAKISFQELRRLNPELRRDVTPPDIEAYHLKVPIGTTDLVNQALQRTPTWKPTPILVKKGRRGGESPGWYKVRVGDSLWTIAKRFRLTVQELKARNSLSNRGIKPGDLLSIGPAVR
jgi:membrane-bound lytic murein transglycosylase D